MSVDWHDPVEVALLSVIAFGMCVVLANMLWSIVEAASVLWERIAGRYTAMMTLQEFFARAERESGGQGEARIKVATVDRMGTVQISFEFADHGPETFVVRNDSVTTLREGTP